MAISHQPAHRRAASGIHGRAQKGYVLVMFALLLVPMLLVAGFSVDVGSWYNRASDMRKAADAAALAGVVWLPDTGKATSVALDVATRNGFAPSGTVSVAVTVSNQSSRRLKVTITDTAVGSFFFENLGGRKINLTRSSFAEYVLPVPMGSPRNFFGTGRLLENDIVPGFEPELLWQSVNTYCSDKVNGDRHQPMSNVGSQCSGNQTERKPYELYIEAPKDRTSNIDVLLYDPRFNDQGIPNNKVVGQNCVDTWNPSSGWIDTNGFATPSVTGYAQYQLRNGSNTNWASTVYTIGEGNTLNFSSVPRFRYRTRTTSCTDIIGTENAIDRYFGGSGNEAYTFTLFNADDTPLNDNDNTVKSGCTQTFNQGTPFDPITYLDSVRWNKLCTILPGDHDGKYILRVENSGSASPKVNGENNWGLVAKYQTGSLCDGRTDVMCPRVYGKEAISVRAVTAAPVASFFLAEIPPEHKGKKLKLELFDPGEGGSKMEIMMPSGTNGKSWTPATFDWSSSQSSDGSGTGVSSVDVTGDKFNGNVLYITVDLATYTPPGNNNWWQVRYTFGNGTVNDRTTWSAKIVGDPVHLVEEY